MLLFPVGLYSSSSGSSVTWNPSDKSADITLSGGNLVIGKSVSNYAAVRSTTSKSTGKFYVEITNGQATADGGIGISNATAALSDPNYPGEDLNGIFYYGSGGSVYLNNSVVSTQPQNSGAGTVVAMAVDLGSKLLWIKVGAGTWNNASADPAAGTGGISFSTINAGPYFVTGYLYNAGYTLTARFASGSWSGAPPSGFSQWT